MSVANNENAKKDSFKSGCANCCCCFKRRKQMSVSETKETSTLQEEENSARVPFFGDLPEDLGPGKAICISCYLLPTCLRFTINLTCGKGPNADIGFHFNPRLEQKYVVRNCRLNGHWGVEETTSTQNFDFERSENADVNVFLTDEQFLVSVNGKHYCAFTHRVPLSQLTGIEVHGMVDVLQVTYKDFQTYPEHGEENKPPIVAMADTADDEEQHIVIPFVGYLPQGLKTGWQLEIYGRVKILPHSFTINLQEGYHVWPHPVVPLHLNPRFSTTMGENVFVRNAWLNSWGAEERAPGFPFAPGAPFTVAVRRAADHFSVWVDGKLAGEFSFRTNVDQIDTVSVHGDVVVKKILMSDRMGEACYTPECKVVCNDTPEEEL